ncbi:MAG: Gfo/Idh/MocA family oxidoreductase [Faecalibacterium sp.]|nr:Gfo/Idh/MocA family oxidoreductase [Faecalibacterium sp.]
MLHWGLLATGVIARKFAATVNAMGQAEQNVLVACAAREQTRAQAFADEFSIPTAYGSYEQLVNDPAVDIVYISSPNNLHAEHIRLCLAHGKHVLCEKPFTFIAKDAAELYALAAEKGLFLMEALWTYHLPLIQKAQQLLAEGAIGQVQHLRADYGFIATGARRVRKFRSELAGGALLDIGIYNLAFARQMLGSHLGNFTGQPKLSEFGTDWFSHITGEYAGGITAAMTACIGLQMPVQGVVYGTEGQLFFPNYQQAQKMVLIKNNGEEEVFEMPFDHTGFEYQVRECARCIAQGLTASPVYPPQTSIAHMDELDRIRAAWGMKFACEA